MKLSWPPVSDLTNYQEVSNFDRKLQILNASSELEKKNKPVFAEVASNDNFSSMSVVISDVNSYASFAKFFRFVRLHSLNSVQRRN